MSHSRPLEHTEYSRDLCIHHLIAIHADLTPEAIAVAAPGRDPLTYCRFRSQIEETVKTLNAMGIGRDDRVAIVLPNGPEMAVALMAVAAGATCAPLNPAYSASEFDFYLSDLNAKILIIQAGNTSPAIAVARSRGLRVVELSPLLEVEAGLFTLTGEKSSRSISGGFTQPDDVALVVHTSGTTSRPKIIPLSQANICAAGHNMRVSVNLVSSDRCLNVMPLFHTHGLSTLFSSFVAGGSVICTPDFYAPKFFEWMDTFRPTWYTVAPTIHQLILGRAPFNREIIARCPLRFIRTASSPIPPQVFAELERVFNVPLIEAYGLAEAAPGVTSNPLPPRPRKPGSVGIAAGPEVAIMDEVGNFLPPGETGEIVVRGANVMRGYENNPEANQRAFIEGWLRTGDLGYLDIDGYLFVTGRIKETINRGGEKISPREIDEVLMDHPAILQVVTFAIPDPKLGEDVAAAVVLREGASATAKEIREFAATRLSHFKVPCQVAIVAEIPCGPTGKLQRIGLAEKLGLTALDRAVSDRKAAFVAPRTYTEELLAEIWAEVLGLGRVGRYDNFFHLGGDSILVARVISRLQEAMQVELPFLTFFDNPTITDIAKYVEADNRTEKLIVAPIQPTSRNVELPLSYTEQGLWFLDQLDPGNSAYNIYRAVRLTGSVERIVLEQCLNEIVQRHEILRTTFPSIDGRPVRAIAPTLTLALPLVDLAVSHVERETALHQLAVREAQRPFDLAAGPLLRTTLLRLSEEEHVLLLVTHHIVGDAWSLGIFFQELAALYQAFAAGKPSPLTAPAIQYADFAVWQRQWLRDAVLEKQLSYWKQQLSDAPPLLELPMSRSRPTVQTFKGARQSLLLPQTIAKSLKTSSQEEGVTLFMILLAAFEVLLYQYTGQEDIVVGSPVAGRNRVEIEQSIGFFSNTLVLRTDLSGEPTFRQFLSRVRQVTLGAYAHQDLPFSKLVEVLRPGRNLSHTPLFQIHFRLQNVPMPVLQLGDVAISLMEVDYGMAKFDLAVELWEKPEGLGGHVEYNTDLFDAAAIAQMLIDFKKVLNVVVTQPDTSISALEVFRQRKSTQPDMESTEKALPEPQKIESFKGVRRKAVNLSNVSTIETSYFQPDRILPLIVQPATDNIDLVDWAEHNRNFIETNLLRHGGLLFRKFNVKSVTEFEQFIKAISGHLLKYTYRSTPRTQVSGSIYTSTEYPADQSIPLHSEMSYSANWPMKIWFFCVKAAERGGETPIADNRKVLQRLNVNVRERFRQKGVMYVRNYGNGLDLLWQDVFQTTKKSDVEDYCRSHGIEFEWKEGDRLRTSQLCQAVATHPLTGDTVWFNQAHLFHVSSLKPELRELLLSTFKEDELPRNAYYGDGSPIENSVLNEIREIYQQESVTFPWQEGDILMLDNMSIAHGRKPFVGSRKIVVGMAESSK